MLYSPMDFGELTLDGLVDTGALSSAIPEADLRKFRLLAAPQSLIKEGRFPNLVVMMKMIIQVYGKLQFLTKRDCTR